MEDQLVPKIKILKREKGQMKKNNFNEKTNAPKKTLDMIDNKILQEIQILEIIKNEEMSINYVSTLEKWN